MKEGAAKVKKRRNTTAADMIGMLTKKKDTKTATILSPNDIQNKTQSKSERELMNALKEEY